VVVVKKMGLRGQDLHGSLADHAGVVSGSAEEEGISDGV
jgi:hypothetical protein